MKELQKIIENSDKDTAKAIREFLGTSSQDLVEILIEEAKKPTPIVKKKYVPAYTLIKITKKGELYDPYPDISDKNQLVLVEMHEEQKPPDTTLLMYVLDKIIGRARIDDAPQGQERKIKVNLNPSHKELPEPKNGNIIKLPEELTKRDSEADLIKEQEKEKEKEKENGGEEREQEE